MLVKYIRIVPGVNTVAISPTLQSMAALGLLVLVRTSLSWSLIVEIEGRWPWQRAQMEAGTHVGSNRQRRSNQPPGLRKPRVPLIKNELITAWTRGTP
jgi:hypothetical protein